MVFSVFGHASSIVVRGNEAVAEISVDLLPSPTVYTYPDPCSAYDPAYVNSIHFWVCRGRTYRYPIH